MIATFAPELKQPVGMAQNDKGDIFITDWMSGCVHCYNENGHELTKFNLSMEAPAYIAAGKDGFLVISDWKSNVVKAFDASGQFLFKYGDHGSGENQLDHPYGVCLDDYDHIIIADTWNHRVHLVSRDGKFLRYLVTQEHGINFPQAVAIDKEGHLVVAEQQGTIRIVQYIADLYL